MVETIESITTALLNLVSLGVAARVVYIFLMVLLSDEEGGIQRAWMKSKRLIYAGILAQASSGLIRLIENYYR